MSDQPQQQFIVFNYVTNSVLQTDQPPQFGDPNAALQAQVMAAYGSGLSGGVQSLSASASVITATPATLGDPAAVALAAAEASPAVGPELMATIRSSLGDFGALGQVPTMISSMSSHATSVLDNATKVFDAINTEFQPERVGSANRCNSIGEFIGSIQGVYNGSLGRIASTLGTLTSALVAVPALIIGGFVASVTALTTAITSGVVGAINSAVSAVSGATSAVTGAIGTPVAAALSSAMGAVSTVMSGIQKEIDNVASVLNAALLNPFRLVVPNVNPCLTDVLKSANPSATTFSTDVAGRILGGV
jgi:hypothetical protein